MSAGRKLIRQRVVNLLKSYQYGDTPQDAPWGDRVYAARKIPLDISAASLPQLLVYTNSEPGISKFNASPLELRRPLELVVAVVAAMPDPDVDADTFQDTMDDLAQLVEDCLAADRYLLTRTPEEEAALRVLLELEETDPLPVNEEAATNELVLTSVACAETDEPEVLLGITRLEYSAPYFTRAKPDVLENFEEATTDIDIGGNNDQPEIQSEFDIPQE